MVTFIISKPRVTTALHWHYRLHEFLSETRKTSREKLTFQIHIKNRLQNSFHSEWSLVVWNHHSWGTDARSVPISNTALIRAFSASLSEALERSMSECVMRQHAPRLCDRCMKQSSVRYGTSKTTICSLHTHTFTQHTDTYVMCCLYKTT